MFTFGIFSTHLPYIAFVLFYGFFFLTGIEKASAGDHGKETGTISENTILQVNYFTDSDDSNIFDTVSYTGIPEFEQLLLYDKKISLPGSAICFLNAADYRFPWFSRPPPRS